jgi:hypothetical protein
LTADGCRPSPCSSADRHPPLKYINAAQLSFSHQH